MSRLDPNRSYTFSEIAKLKAPTDELLAEYGYSLERTLLDLPQYEGELDRLQERRLRLSLSPTGLIKFGLKMAQFLLNRSVLLP